MAYEYKIHDGIDFIFEEHQNMFSAIRKITWGTNTNPHLEIRKWMNNPDGSERANKGFTFMTEEGPGELVLALLHLGHGETKQILNVLKDRENFRRSLNSVLGDKDPDFDPKSGTIEDDFFDPKDLLMNK